MKEITGKNKIGDKSTVIVNNKQNKKKPYNKEERYVKDFA
jgi:hypothetical protein